MDIIFRNNRLLKMANTQASARASLGKVGGDRFMRRLEEMYSSDTLAILKTLPQARCHALKGNRKGQFAVDLDQPYRLIFEPANDPLPTLPDGGFDLEQITKVLILRIEDYHD